MYRRRFSAADIFRRDYRFHTTAMLKSVLEKNKIMPPKYDWSGEFDVDVDVGH